MSRLTIFDQYLGFTPIPHKPSCSRAGTGMWEVARLHRTQLGPEGPYTETVIRMMCTECGVVHLDHCRLSGTSTVTVAETGYGAEPIKAAGLWLHPGPVGNKRPRELAPELYYVTGSRKPPRDHSEVIGIIGWTRPWMGTRHGAVRWWAGLGITLKGSAVTLAPETPRLRSRTAAARWVAQQHAAAEVPA